MRRSPFYSFSNFPHSFYAPPSEAAHRRPFPSSSPAPPPTRTSRSVVNIPVSDSAPSRPSSSSPPPLHQFTSPPASIAVLPIDPSSAATKIQSHFRGFCVRKHHPLLHLRSIAKARKQLEELQSEIRSPGFSDKVRTNEKERLRFCEGVMAIILRLDAIEGSIAEVRSQRKEATKMAIKLQDAIDAIITLEDDIAPLNSTAGPFSDGGIAPEEESVGREQSRESLPSDVNLVRQGGAYPLPEESSKMDASTIQEKPTFCEVDVAVADNCMPERDKDGIMGMASENVSPFLPLNVEDVGQPRELGLGCLESAVPQTLCGEAMYDVEQGMSHVTGEKAESDATPHAAEEEVNSRIEALHFDANHTHNNALRAKLKQDTSADDMTAANPGSAKAVSSDGSYTCMDVAQEVVEGASQVVEFCPGTPAGEEKCDHPDAPQNQLRGSSSSIAAGRLIDCNSSDRKGSPKLHSNGYQKGSNVADESYTDELIPCDDVKAQSPSPSMIRTPSPCDNAMLQQLSEDCRQLRSLVGKLLVQNKAQSNVLCALGERLELLEQQQQQFSHQRSQLKTREKRKLKKGSKRSVKCRNCE